MPSVKIPKKSTWTDMTPFVDVAFLILAFFIMATKFKPPQPVEITTPKSVSSDKLKEQNALQIDMDKDGRVFLTVNVLKDHTIKKSVIENINKTMNLGLNEAEMQSYVNNSMVGVPFSKLKSYLQLSDDDRVKAFEGIPVKDSANNELSYWVAAAANAFSGQQLNFMIKGDNNSKYPTFRGVIDAMRRNDVFKYQLVTDPEGVPVGSELYKLNMKRP